MSVDSVVASLQGMIDEHDVAVLSVMTSPPYSYTCGMSLMGLPDLIVSALSAEVAHGLLNHVAREIIDGRLEPSPNAVMGGALGAKGEFPVRLQPVHPSQAEGRACFAHRIAARRNVPFSVMQVVTPDLQGRWPEDHNYDIDFAVRQVIMDVEYVDDFPPGSPNG